MNRRRVFTQVTDVTLAGDVLRVAHDGLPRLAARDPKGGLAELRAGHEAFRRFLNENDAADSAVNACLLYPPSAPGSDGALYLASQFAYAPFAGTALMAAAATLVDARRHAAEARGDQFVFDTASGVQRVELTVAGGAAAQAAWRTSRPQVLEARARIPREDGALTTATLVSSGLPYIVVEEEALGVPISDQPSLVDAAIRLSRDAGRAASLSAYGLAQDYARYLVLVVRRVASDHVKAVWVSDAGFVGRSAGGTGALAAAAAGEATGAIAAGTRVAVEAPGGTFMARIGADEASVEASLSIRARRRLPDPPL